MHIEEAFSAIEDLKRAMPVLFAGVEVHAVFGEDRPAIGDWSCPDNLGMLVTGDEIGSKSGVYFFGSPTGEILYIGKATKSNLHHRVWGHVKTPEVLDGGRRVFPKHGFTAGADNADPVSHVLKGEVRLGVVTISDPELVSLVEVYLQTVHKKRYGSLPAFNKQIG